MVVEFLERVVSVGHFFFLGFREKRYRLVDFFELHGRFGLFGIVYCHCVFLLDEVLDEHRPVVDAGERYRFVRDSGLRVEVGFQYGFPLRPELRGLGIEPVSGLFEEVAVSRYRVGHEDVADRFAGEPVLVGFSHRADPWFGEEGYEFLDWVFHGIVLWIAYGFDVHEVGFVGRYGVFVSILGDEEFAELGVGYVVGESGTVEFTQQVRFR